MRPDAPVRGTPWLVLTGERAKAVLRGGAVLETSARRVSTLGPDILAPELDADAIVTRLRRLAEQRTIGEALLDQRAVAGIGNIWRSEALWHARISPWRQLPDLDDGELHDVVARRPPDVEPRTTAAPPPRPRGAPPPGGPSPKQGPAPPPSAPP